MIDTLDNSISPTEGSLVNLLLVCICLYGYE